METSRLDPSHLVQLQFQMQATGAPQGYLISWSRNNLSVHSMSYHAGFIRAAGHVLKHVIEEFVDAGVLPDIPSDVSEMSGELQMAWRHMVPELKDMIASCVREELDTGMLLSSNFPTQEA